MAICALATAACELTPTDDLLSITFESGDLSPPAEVDTLCGNGGCEEAAEVEATITYEDDGTPAKDAVVEILQYRVDYEMGGVEEIVPFYAGETSVRVTLGQATSFVVRVAGDRQRDFFTSRLGSGEVNGVATLLLAGYDDLDEDVRVSASFDIAFGDFVVQSPTGDDPSEDGGAE